MVLPCYNEVDNIEPLIAEIRAALEPTGRSFEIIYVDDFSTDGSYEKLLALAPQMSFLRVVRHRANYGESAAILTGYEHARGQLVFSLDADLQNDPADMPAMLRAIENADMVCGVRQNRKDTWVKRLSSKIANRVRAFVLKDGVSDAGCTFRLVRREALKMLPGFRALHRFQASIIRWHGFRVVEIPINHRPRTRGTSKYGIGNRLWVGIADLIGMRWYRSRHLPPHRAE